MCIRDSNGGNRKENTPPVVTEYLKGRLAISHNGNIINAAALREKLRRAGCDVNATTDSEVVSSLIAYEILQGGGFEEAIVKAAKQLRGAYTLLVLGSGDRLCALRDPSGFRPLCLGRSNHGWAVASESCALDSAGFDFLRDVQPGELITIDGRGRMSSRMALGPAKLGMCLFEYVYFARTDSVIDLSLIHIFAQVLGIGADRGDDVLFDHIQHGKGFDVQRLAVVFEQDLIAGMHLRSTENMMLLEERDIFFCDQIGQRLSLIHI